MSDHLPSSAYSSQLWNPVLPLTLFFNFNYLLYGCLMILLLPPFLLVSLLKFFRITPTLASDRGSLGPILATAGRAMIFFYAAGPFPPIEGHMRDLEFSLPSPTGSSVLLSPNGLHRQEKPFAPKLFAFSD